ncbi:putative membrane protein [Kribbella orskensis]|uniref:Membrane protein n=1 Tax=Kribbella orskensis TaxID=2512216 RepID=A0ABY2B7C3_9ACTN|nr:MULTISPECIES: anthrone oxygenase family protein [Kribbella]TCN30035.1 putative membrane protein [Kribbella sp. VKM Ac-2500]TCO10217.1 putative membrane protein [Kribbella orskensis]
MNGLRMAVLLAATLTTGLMAGVYVIYSNAFMPGLGKTDDKTFVGAFQAVDRAILNPLFLGLGFLGSLVLTLVAGLLSLGEDALAWIAIAFVLNLVTVIITIAVNVPLNDALKAAGDPDTIDVTAARTAFNEARWRSYNLIRSVLSTVAFGLLAWSLYLTGKSAAQP